MSGPRTKQLIIPIMRRVLFGGVHRILLSINNVYYKRIGSTNKAYTRRPEMEAWLTKQGPDRLAVSLRILAVLGQSKAYLYWSSQNQIEESEIPSHSCKNIFFRKCHPTGKFEYPTGNLPAQNRG